MSSEHTISIAAAGPDGSRRTREADVSIPVGEVMASNGLVTGQSGADTVGSVRRVTEELIAAGETLLVVDPSGDLAGLADDATALHVGGNHTCDVEVQPSAADRVATLSLEGSTSVVLDLQAFDATEAADLLGGLTDALVEARRERPSDLLVLVGECHRWLADDGPATRTGENLVKLGGRRHDGVGVVGVTDQPADLREAVLGGVDWVLAHRLTWGEDVRAMERLLDRQYTDALADLADDEAFFNAGWERGVTRLRFGVEPDRTTAEPEDTGAGIDDLLADVPQATPPTERTPADDATDAGATGTGQLTEDDEVADLRADLADIDERLASLEATLDEREDVATMADRIADAITEGLAGSDVAASMAAESSERADDEPAAGIDRSGSAVESGDDASTDTATDETANEETANDDGPGAFGDVFGMFDDNDTVETPETGDGDASSDDGAVASDPSPTASSTTDSNDPTPTTEGPGFGVAAGTDAGDGHATDDRAGDDGSSGMSFKPIDFGFDEPSQAMDSTVPEDFGPPSRRASSGRSIPRYLRKIVRAIEEMDETTLKMLGFYIDEGTESPMDAHFSAGGGGDRTRAYAHNRQLRTNGLIEHVGKGKYAPRLREYVVDRAGHSVPEHELDRAVRIIEQTVDAA